MKLVAAETLPDTLPAAQTVATVEKYRDRHIVRLPPRFAHAAVRRLLEAHHARGEIIDGPADLGRAIGAEAWAIALEPGVGAPLHLCAPTHAYAGRRIFVFPRHVICASPADAARLLRALEDVKPEELDADGRPLPWVPLHRKTEALGGREDDEDDATFVAHPDELPAIAARPEARSDPKPDPTISGWLDALARTAGLTRPMLDVTRAQQSRLGFCAGRVFLDRDFAPLLIQLEPCPNSDAAEVLATLTHELAHPLARTRLHDLAFKRTLVELAERHFGARWFVGARAHLERPFRVVDYWVASGIRAALKGGEPPALKGGDDGQLAKVLGRIRKLRDLAHDQLGQPEGIAATAAANDLITTYGLESYSVHIDAGLHEQMVDRFVPLEDGAVWRRTLAHGVAAYCDVFSLAIPGKHRMHYFGRHGDVIAAEYLYSVSAARVVRECDLHLASWKLQHRPSAGESRRERTSFCDSAAIAFREKLVRLKSEDGPTRPETLDAAEDFADHEHDKRGSSWGSGGRRTYRVNTAGRELGQAMEVLHGLDGTGDRPRALPHK